MKFKILQEVVNKRYCVHYYVPKSGFTWGWDSTNIIKNIEEVKLLLQYDIGVQVEIIDREIFCEFEKQDMDYKIEDEIWIDNIAYKIKNIKNENQEIKIYLDKQRIVQEIGKEEAEKLLKEIKDRQRNMREEKNNSNIVNKSLVYKIKKIFKRR